MTDTASGVKLDLHNHTHFSADGVMTPGALLAKAAARGIACIAVTDHNTVRGALEAVSLAASDPTLPRVIPGIELATEAGEVIGLYVSDEIPRGLALTESVDRIREQGGLVYLPHPYDVFRRGAIDKDERDAAARAADIVEVVNGRSLSACSGRKSQRLAGVAGRPGGAGSDAHRAGEVGRAVVLVRECPTRDTLVALVGEGSVSHSLGVWQYATNWGRQALAPVTRLRRKIGERPVGR